jgi:flagellar FliJ protein
MSTSERFKPIQRIASHRERKAAAALGESLKQRQAAVQRLEDLRRYHAEYLERFSQAARCGLSSGQALEYQVFLGKLEAAIDQQEEIVARSEQACENSKADWRGKHSKAKAMDNAVGRMHEAEGRKRVRKEQAESDDRAQRKR